MGGERLEIAGGVVLVTGGAKRVGRAIVLRLAASGAVIAVHCNTSEGPARETVDAISTAGGRARTFVADLQDQDAVQALVPTVIDALGSLNVLVNNASVFRQVPMAKTARDDWEESMALHVWAPFRLSQAMIEGLGDRPGKIINLNDARQARPNQFAYGVSKSALSGLTRSLAAAAGPNIQVNEIALGAILPPPGSSPAQVARLAAGSPARRWGSPDEVASLVEALIENDFINGETIHIDGGRAGTRR